MITESDSYNTIEFDQYYAILPPGINKVKYLNHYNANEVTPGFKYNSDTNHEWVDEQEIQAMIRKYVDPDFEPIK